MSKKDPGQKFPVSTPVSPQQPHLLLISTPIGNLKDLSPSMVQALSSVDVLICEDTRRTKLLLSQAKVERSGPVLSFHEHSPSSVLQKVSGLFNEGKTVGYATDAGVPAVSDPGFELVHLAGRMNVPVKIIPGPSAVTAFFAVCGLPSPKFFFHGFFPRTQGEIEKVLEEIRSLPVVHIFYEAPNRVDKTLAVLEKHFPENPTAFSREISKIYEETIRGKPRELLKNLQDKDRIRGEFVFGILGGSATASKPKTSASSEFQPSNAPSEKTELHLSEEQKNELMEALKKGDGSKVVSKDFSKQWGVSRRALYEYIVKHLT